MSSVFDRPQFVLQPDQIERLYANVSNVLAVCYSNGRQVDKLIAVPTGLFTLMRQVFRVELNESVSLSLDQFEERWMLVLNVGNAGEFYDLWSYSRASVPAWLMR